MNKRNRVFVGIIFFCFYPILSVKGQNMKYLLQASISTETDKNCGHVCDDLPLDDLDPVCMMYSRYKKGYQFFVNHCHARRVICKDDILLHMVHPNRCMKSKQNFLPIL